MEPLLKATKENLKLCKTEVELRKLNRLNNKNIVLVLRELKQESKTVGEKKRYEILLAGFKKIKYLIKGRCLEEKRKAGYGISCPSTSSVLSSEQCSVCWVNVSTIELFLFC